tara:strand:- start:129 stop:491 length:363 start_codon:yes stop_codon:yes gene_type:complete
MQQSQVNPPATTTAVSTAPTREVSFFSVDYINAVNGSAGPRGAQAAVLFTIQETLTIIDIGPLTNSNTEQTFAIESNDGDTIGENLLLQRRLRTAIRALGTYDGIDLTSSTVTFQELDLS